MTEDTLFNWKKKKSQKEWLWKDKKRGDCKNKDTTTKMCPLSKIWMRILNSNPMPGPATSPY